jgi:hypothetical protein
MDGRRFPADAMAAWTNAPGTSDSCAWISKVQVIDVFLNSAVSFCSAACVEITIPSRCGGIPTWGREQARYRFDRGGLFIARTFPARVECRP